MEKNDNNTSLTDLKKHVQLFIHERQWEVFHTPKNLAESICIESAELLEKFQWLTIEQVTMKIENQKFKNAIEDEIADVLIYCLSFSLACDIDIASSIITKLKKNVEKYPKNKKFNP